MGSEVAAGRFDTHAAPAPPASVARAVVQFVVAGLVAVVVFVAGSLLVLRELGDREEPENRFERGQGDLYEVYTRLRAPDGTPLLFETYQRGNALVAEGRDVWLPFAVPVLASLVLLWLVQVPLAWRLAGRLRRSQLEREALLVHAVEASADERRRIAADLHDGVVQDLAGLSYSLSAAAERAPERTPPAIVAAVTDG